MKRERRIKKRNVFNTGIEYIPTGCPPLDCVLGGGYAMGRVINIIGDRSTGKTLLAMEAFANFHNKFGGACRYYEAESAWDEKYAESLGIPVKAIKLIDNTEQTAEDLADDIENWLKQRIADGWDKHGLIAIDSWDALSTNQDRDQKSHSEGTYGMSKAKLASSFFRIVVGLLERAGVTLIIVSQVRDNIDAGAFSKKYRRNGGKSLDFFSSQILWLAEKGKLRKTIKGVKRVIGIDVIATVEKNKVGLPFRQCNMSMFFSYGIDDISACLGYLKEVNYPLPKWITAKERDRLIRGTAHLDLNRAYLAELRDTLEPLVVQAYEDTEREFLPRRSKY